LARLASFRTAKRFNRIASLSPQVQASFTIGAFPAVVMVSPLTINFLLHMPLATNGMASRQVANFLPYTLAVFSRLQKLSVGELTQQFPFLLLDERISQPRSASCISWLQYWADSIGRRNTFNHGGVLWDDLQGGCRS
jgi:hypothetical protein